MMLNFIKKLLGLGPKINYQKLLEDGGKIIDVRSKSEYDSGNISGSIHIPLENIAGGVAKLNLDKSIPIITVCASGMRSGIAKTILITNGFETVHNGGSWLGLLKKIT